MPLESPTIADDTVTAIEPFVKIESAIDADPAFLDHSVLETLISASEQKKGADLRNAGMSPFFESDVAGPWEMLQAHVSNFVAGGDVNGTPQESDSFSRSVQMVTVPTAATWDDPKYGPYRLCKVLGDSMPKWRPTFETAATSFGDAYGMFIESILIPTATKAQQLEIDQARENWQVALLKVRTREEIIGDNWVQFDKKQAVLPPARRLSFDAYYAKYELPILSSMRRALLSYQQTFTKKINDYTKGYGHVAEMIARYSSDSAMFFTPAEGVGDDKSQSVYRYSVDQSLKDFKTRAAGQPSDAIRWDFTNHSFRLTSSSSYWGGGASYGFFCRGSAGGSRSHIDWHSADFKLVFKAKAIEKFTLSPDDWYSGELIKTFKNGEFVSGSVADLAMRANNLWHPKGILALRASSLILVYEPSIELTISKADYERNTSEWHAGGGFSVGCFSFGAHAGGSSEDVKYDDASCTIRATDTTGIPKLMAVNNDVLPDLS